MTNESPHLSHADLDELVENSLDAWECLRGERVFMTGGTGFVGTWMSEAFVWANRSLSLGASLTLLTRDAVRFARKAPHLASDPSIALLTGDAATFSVPSGHYRFVIHAATSTHLDPSTASPLAMLDADLAATRRVLEAARSMQAERVLFTSSGAAYGVQPTDIDAISEDSPHAPLTQDVLASYGHGKRLSEFACANYAHRYGMNVSIARLFAFVGPHLPLDANFAIGNFIGDVLAGRPIAINGDGTPLRSYLYAADMARWCWTILVSGQTGRIYNVGSDVAISIHELARLVASTLATETSITVARQSIAGIRPPRYVPAVNRVANELGLRVAVSLADGIRRTADWYRRYHAVQPPSTTTF